MQRLILVVLVSAPALLNSENAQAQGASLGVVGGVNIASQSTDYEGADLDSRVGLVAGAHLSIDFSPIAGLMLEALYSQKGHTFTVDGVGTGISLAYVEFPILVKFRVPASEANKVLVHFAAGPALGLEVGCGANGVRINSGDVVGPPLPPPLEPPPITLPHLIHSFESYSSPEQGGTSVSFDCDEIGADTKSVDFGIMALGGLEIPVGAGAMILDVGYTLGLTDVNDTTDDEFIKNRSLHFKAGYTFFLGWD